jgi:Family of unknown function (DUF5990)
MQQGRDLILPGTGQPDDTTWHETEVTAYMDTKGRLRYRGACVQGKPEESFVYLSWRVVGKFEWVMRAKLILTPLTQAYVSSLADGTTLGARLNRMGGMPRGHVQEWFEV